MLPKDWEKRERKNDHGQIVFYYVSPEGKEFNSLFDVKKEVNRKNELKSISSTLTPPTITPKPQKITTLSSSSSSSSLSTRATGHKEIEYDPNDKWFGLCGTKRKNVLTPKEWLEERQKKRWKYIKNPQEIKSIAELGKKKTYSGEVLSKYAPEVPEKGRDSARKSLLDQLTHHQGWHKHDGIPSSYIEILCEIECNSDVFHEIDPDTPCFGANLTQYFNGKTCIHAKTNVCIDRIYKIGDEGDGIPKKGEPFAFYSNPNFKTIISCARGTLSQKEQLIFHPTCQEALRPIKGYQYCLIFGYSPEDVHEGEVPPSKMTKITYGYCTKLGKAAFCAGQNSVKPLLLVLFRKVRKSDLWITTRNNELLGSPAPISAIPYKMTDEIEVANTRKFFERLQQKSSDFCSTKGVEMYMIPKVVCVTGKYICLSSRAPRENLDLIIAPRFPLNWDALSGTDVGEIIGLYTFAHYIRSIIRELGTCMANMEILFPIDPAQWLVHCHVMKCDANSETRKQFLSVDEFLERLNSGEIGRDSGFRVHAEYDKGLWMPVPEPDPSKTPADQRIDVYEYVLSQNNGFFSQYWYGGSGDEPIVKYPNAITQQNIPN